MKYLHQVIVSASPGDAITNEAFEIRNILREFGDSEIFARYVHPSLGQEVFPLTDYDKRVPANPSDGFLIFHASIGECDVHSFLIERPERLIIIYHNISPSQSFTAYDPSFAALLDQGRAELAMLKDRTTLALADSGFNATELEQLGYREVRVSPLIVDFQKLLGTTPSPSTKSHLEVHVDGPAILFVGQLLPHKRPDLLVQAYHVLATYLAHDCFLFLVGWARLPRYRVVLQGFIEELNLPNAWITQSVSDEELTAFYQQADVFVTMSEHEGFCAPVLEAMAFGVPVVARRQAALPETIGEAGLLLPSEEDPLIAAEAIAAILADASLRKELTARGEDRFKQFDPQITRATFRDHIASLL